MVADPLPIAATVAGLMMAASPALQIRRMLQMRSSADVSIGYLALLQLGFIVWLTYGLTLSNAAMVIANIASLLFGATTILFALRLRTPRR